jgi:hypothetical protein
MNISNIRTMTDETLADAKAILGCEIASIRLQLDRNSQPPHEWLAKANYALRMKETQLQRIRDEEAQRRRHEQTALERRFVAASQTALGEDFFSRLMAVARHPA